MSFAKGRGICGLRLFRASADHRIESLRPANTTQKGQLPQTLHRVTFNPTSQEESHMSRDDNVPDQSDGVRLPSRVWEVLHRENIRTVSQLRAAADRIERFTGVGPKTAQAIRDELARVAALESRSPDP